MWNVLQLVHGQLYKPGPGSLWSGLLFPGINNSNMGSDIPAPLWSALEKNDFWFHAIFTPYFFEKYGGRWETYGIYGVVEDDILSILWNFGFSSIRPFSVRGLRSYYIKAKGWIIKMAVNKPFLYQFWWNFVCSLLLEPHLHRKIFSKVVKAKSQKVARSKGQNSKNFLQTIWVKPKALLMVLHQFSS